jgi:hypothetical protein
MTVWADEIPDDAQESTSVPSAYEGGIELTSTQDLALQQETPIVAPATLPALPGVSPEGGAADHHGNTTGGQRAPVEAGR